METLMFTFHKYAGDKNYLSKEDLRALMEKEFPGFLENQRDPMALDKIMKDLDQCRDGKVGFQSFFSCRGGRGQCGRDPSGAAGSREAVALRPAPERGALGPAQRCGQPGDAPPRLPPPAGIAEPAWEVPGADRGR